MAPRLAPSDVPVDWEIPAEPDTFVTQALSDPLPSPIPVPADLGPRRPLPSLDWELPAADMTLAVEQLIEQARSFACRSCSTPVPLTANFCPRCGAAVPPEILGARAQLPGPAMGKARLILIHGTGVPGASYHLDADGHLVDRNGERVVPCDHRAKLFYRNGALVVRDDGSADGVFVRVKGTVPITPGDQLMVGDQLVQLDADPTVPFRLTQILPGGSAGLTVRARGSTVKIGREMGDMNLRDDPHVSASHCILEDRGGTFVLIDLNSRNGTYLRIKAERALTHGDYVFLGKRLFRVEILQA
jgi:pSer/pThr/pTyr-binding forkhead associated (FHA) protein